MATAYLFDWGDTLMVDLPGQGGKMRDWPEVAAVDGAADALEHLSQTARIYVATNAIDSDEDDIRSALDRVGLSRYITGYFCRANLGIGKGSPGYFRAIMDLLGIDPGEATMVGDSYENDILPALQAGLNAIWLKPGGGREFENPDWRMIGSLHELCEAG